MTNFVLRTTAFVAAALFATLPAFAQITVGSISGTITDSTGAAVPGCALTAANSQTGHTTTVRTQETGLYVFASLPAGTYNLTAEKTGFRNSERSGVSAAPSILRSRSAP